MDRDTALEIAREMDRRALLHDSRGDYALTEQELSATVETILNARVHPVDDVRVEEIRRWVNRRISRNSDPYADLSRALGYIDRLLSLLPQLSGSERGESNE